jgi:HEAT repeat protein
MKLHCNSHDVARKAVVFACASIFFLAIGGAIGTRAEEPGKAEASAKDASSSAVSKEEIARSIAELSHDAFTVRQAAAARLLAAGAAAREALLAIVDGPDPETRSAARRLIAQIDQTEFHRRLDAFAADTDGSLGITLPGWERFKKAIGSDPQARALFVDMQRQEGALIAAAFGGTKRTNGELLEARLMRLIQWQNSVGDRTAAPPLGSCAAMLFLGAVPDVDVSDGAAQQIEGLLQRSPVLEALRSDNREGAVRRLVVDWLLNCPTKNEGVLQHRLSMISAVGLDDGLPLALKVVAGEPPHKRVSPSTRALAALVVGQFGKTEHVDQLEPLLQDASVCQPAQMQPAATVQVRDVALVVMLQLTDQRPADYGYVNARSQGRTFQLPSLFRDNDEQRAEAIAKWRAWRAEQKRPAAKDK